MYDPSWPHGHTFSGMSCRILADDLNLGDGRTIAVSCYLISHSRDHIFILLPNELEPVPAPKKRIQGWIIIGHNAYGLPYLGNVLFRTKEHALASVGDRACAIVYIDVEEGEGLEQQT